MRLNTGRDWQAKVMGDTASNGSGPYAPANYIGMTSDNAAPLATDTTLANEIVAGTLTRAQAAYAHTTGTASYSLTKTFTADQSVTINKIGVFWSPSSPTAIVFETTLNAPAVLVSGDQLQITETVTL